MAKMIHLDPLRCLGCHSCVLQCAMAHSDVETFPEAVTVDEKPQARVHMEKAGDCAVPMQCQHCEAAPCVAVCPADAIQRSEPGFPVLIDGEKCTGCGFCIAVCPFGAIEKVRGGKKALKCDLCKDRPDGELPACVTACQTGAIRFEEPTEKWQADRQKVWDALMETFRTAPPEAEDDDPDEKKAACVVCGIRFAPKKLLPVLRKKAGDGTVVPAICPACKRHLAATCIAELTDSKTPEMKLQEAKEK